MPVVATVGRNQSVSVRHHRHGMRFDQNGDVRIPLGGHGEVVHDHESMVLGKFTAALEKSSTAVAAICLCYRRRLARPGQTQNSILCKSINICGKRLYVRTDISFLACF